MVKSPPAMQEMDSIPGLRSSPGRREWISPPGFLLGESHGQRNLAGYSPWDRKEVDTTEQVSAHSDSFSDRYRRTSHFFSSPHKVAMWPKAPWLSSLTTSGGRTQYREQKLVHSRPSTHLCWINSCQEYPSLTLHSG